MANTPRYLYGSANPVEAPFDQTDATVTFAPGDLVYLSSGNVTPIGSVTVTTSFLGASAQRKVAGITGTAKRLFGNSTDGVIRVDTDGVWEYSRSDTVALVVGDYLAPTGTTTVAKTFSETIAVGQCVKAVAAGGTRVRMRILSAKATNARQAT